MSVELANITFDCQNALTVADFWSGALECTVDPDGSSEFASIGFAAGASPAWLFAKVPEGKSAKNRMHLDLVAADREAEVDRLIGLGAERLADVEEWGHRWTVLRDPEGNEFCVAQQATSAEAGAE